MAPEVKQRIHREQALLAGKRVVVIMTRTHKPMDLVEPRAKPTGGVP